MSAEDRTAELAGRYTAAELAGLVTDLEDQLVGVRVKLGERTDARDRLAATLRSIGRGEWTLVGAVKAAQEALDELASDKGDR